MKMYCSRKRHAVSEKSEQELALFRSRTLEFLGLLRAYNDLNPIYPKDKNKGHRDLMLDSLCHSVNIRNAILLYNFFFRCAVAVFHDIDAFCRFIQ